MAIFYTSVLSGIVGTVIAILWKLNQKQPENLQEDKQRINELAENITINHFVKLLNNNPNITFDDAILDFENAVDTDLSTFAIKKNRTKHMYHKSYQKMFDLAIDIYYNNYLV